MQDPPKHGLGIALSDDDLHALGAIVAVWAIAETTMRHLLYQFHSYPAVAATKIPIEPITTFARKCDNWKKSVKLLAPIMRNIEVLVAF